MSVFNRMLVVLFIVFTVTAVFGVEGGEAPGIVEVDESAEPVDNYRLVVNGQEMAVFADRDVELPADSAKAKVRLIVAPDKQFTYGGISLSYPRYFTFESDLSEPGVKLWSLSGNKAVLMVQRYPVAMDHRAMAEQLLPSFGEGNSTLGDCEMTMAGAKTVGSRVVTSIGEGTIAQEIYSFEMKAGSLLLILQDTIEPAGKNSDEFTAFRDMLSKTFKITR